MSTPFGSGDCVFVRHPKHSWVVGHVVSSTGGTSMIKCDDPERMVVGEVLEKVKPEDVTPCREDLLKETPNDLLELTVLHDATLLRCLYIRYMQDIVYTNIGAIVVALNPFNFLIPWYQDDQMPKYLSEGTVIEKNLPHSWAQAHNTYHEMMIDRENQCILISGESGAGKTEATKIVMKYLAQISSRRGTVEEREAGMLVGTKLNSCSPILESFGNARTVRNDNSSRFGKFMKVKFLESGRLVGAHTTKYLLEKSRIVTAAKDERVYHAFYLAPRGSMSAKIGLESITAYKSLNSGGCLDNSEFSTAEHFEEVCQAMRTMGMNETEIESVWMCTGGIMSLLNVGFSPNGEGSQVEPASRKYLDHAWKVWKIDGPTLERLLTTHTLVIPGGEKAVRMLRPDLATDARDALAKALYNGMFGWLVEKSNETCDVNTAAVMNWIGLLDIFGFEDFKFNSFEQLCINLANETLQNHYNGYIFEKDMAECRAEGIDVTEVKCPDNTPCLRLITDKGGILALLDDECSLGKGTDLSFLEQVDTSHGGGKNIFFERKKTSRDSFVVHHYAASVTYNVIGWLEKNRDTLTDDVRRLMRDSKDQLISVFIDPVVPDQKTRRTVGGFFKEQVQELMAVINSTNPHWIRCIKPHPAKKPKMFDGVMTMHQLESSGVLGTVKIRKAGYPIRMTFAKFNLRYRIIAPTAAAGTSQSDRDLSVAILKAVQMNDKRHAQVGKTKLFMKAEAFPLIERKRNELLQTHIRRLQRSGRGLLLRIATNRDWARSLQERLSMRLIEEYRAYTLRSAVERERRAQMRREAEMRFRGLREQCFAEAAAALGELEKEWSAGYWALVSTRTQVLLEERQRIERLKAERHGLMRQETQSREQCYADFMEGLRQFKDLAGREVALYYDLEMASLVEQEHSVRNILFDEECNDRDRLARHFERFFRKMTLLSIDTKAERYRSFLYALEELQRAELVQRFAIARSRHSMLRHLRDQKQIDAREAKNRLRRREQFERWKERELFRLEQIRRDELFRLTSSRAVLGKPPVVPARREERADYFWDALDRNLEVVEAQTAMAHTATHPVVFPRPAASSQLAAVVSPRAQPIPTVSAAHHLSSQRAPVPTDVPLRRASNSPEPQDDDREREWRWDALDQKGTYPSPYRLQARRAAESEYAAWRDRQLALRSESRIARFAHAAEASLEEWSELHQSDPLPSARVGPISASPHSPGISGGGRRHSWLASDRTPQGRPPSAVQR